MLLMEDFNVISLSKEKLGMEVKVIKKILKCQNLGISLILMLSLIWIFLAVSLYDIIVNLEENEYGSIQIRLWWLQIS